MQARNPKTIEALLCEWNRELFDNHNRVKGHINAETEEVIPIDDDDTEMARELQMLELSEGQQDPDKSSDEDDLPLIENQREHDHYNPTDDIYRGDIDVDLPAWAQAPARNALPERQSTPGNLSTISQRNNNPRHAPSTPLTPAPAPAPAPAHAPSPSPVPEIEPPRAHHPSLTTRSTRAAAAAASTVDSEIAGPPDVLGPAADEPLKRGRGRGRVRARK